jgi:hypothetical protein
VLSVEGIEGEALVAPPLVTIVIFWTFEPNAPKAAVVPLIVA